MTDATKATPLSADIQPKIGEYTSPGVQTPPPAIPQDQLTGKTHGRNPSRARAKSRLSLDGRRRYVRRAAYRARAKEVRG
jgi:hypothetical protein